MTQRGDQSRRVTVAAEAALAARGCWGRFTDGGFLVAGLSSSLTAMARVSTCTGMLLLAASAVVHSACSREPVEELETTTKVPVVVQPAVVKTIHGSIVATAVVTPAPGADLIVTAPEAARIAEMPRAEGDRVNKGDLLVRFDIPTMNAALTRSRAEVTQAKARVELARASTERLSGLFERGVAARKDVEDARRELADAEAALAQAESATATASSLASRTAVRAPFAGVVARRWHNPGAMVE